MKIKVSKIVSPSWLYYYSGKLSADIKMKNYNIKASFVRPEEMKAWANIMVLMKSSGY